MATRRKPAPPPEEPASWTFLTNHAHVLLVLAANPEARMRDVAQVVGITERAVQRIVHELEQAGYLAHERDGRRNVYDVNGKLPLRHPLESHCSVSALFSLLERPEGRRRQQPGGGRARPVLASCDAPSALRALVPAGCLWLV